MQPDRRLVKAVHQFTHTYISWKWTVCWWLGWMTVLTPLCVKTCIFTNLFGVETPKNTGNRSTYCTKSFSCLAEVEKFGWSVQTKCGDGFTQINHKVQGYLSLTLQLWRNQDKNILYPALIYKETEMSYFHPFFLRYQISIGWLSWSQYCEDIDRIFFLKIYFFCQMLWGVFLSLFLRDWGRGEILTRQWKGN